MLLEQLAHEPPGRVPVAAALHQYVEHRTVLVYRAPQPVLLAVDGDHHLIEVPLIASGQRGRADAPGDTQAELHRPASHRLVSEFNATSRQQLLDHTQAQRKTVIQPHRVADYVGRKSVARTGNSVVGRFAL